MKFLSLILILFSFTATAATKTQKLPVWSESEKYQSKIIQTIPFLKNNYIAFAGINYGFKNGIGVDAMACKKLSRYLCGGARIFLGSLKSQALVRGPTPLEATTPPNSSEIEDILTSPSTNWFAFVPEIGLTVHTQIIPLAEAQWSESAWFGFGKAFIGGRSGWAISFEPGVNKKFAADSNFGWTLRGKYTFGWLSPKVSTASVGTIPYDWFNLTAGIIYAW